MVTASSGVISVGTSQLVGRSDASFESSPTLDVIHVHRDGVARFEKNTAALVAVCMIAGCFGEDDMRSGESKVAHIATSMQR